MNDLFSRLTEYIQAKKHDILKLMINDQPESQIKKKKKTKYKIKTKLFMYCLFYHSQYVYQN